MKKRFALIAILFFTCGKLISQQYSFNDAQVWFNLYLEKKLSKGFSVHLNQQDRWTNNVSQYNFGYADIGFTYKLTKDIKVFADYVYTRKLINIQDEDMNHYYGTIHQFYIAATIKKDFRRWRAMYRGMYQFQYNNPYASDLGLIPLQYYRNKFIVKYSYNKRYAFYAAEELYIPLNSTNVKGLDRSRTFMGLFYTLLKGHDLELYFMYQSKLQNSQWYKQHEAYNNYQYILEKDFVYGIGYSIEF